MDWRWLQHHLSPNLQNYEVINLPFRNEGLPLLEFEGHTGNTLKKRVPPDWQCQLWMRNQFIMPLIIPLSSKPSFSVGGFPLHRTTGLSLNSAPRATDFEDCFECFWVCLARLVSHVNVLQFLMSIWLWPWSSDTAYCIATVSQESLQQCYNFILLVSGELLWLCLLLGCPSSSPSPDQSPCTPALAHNNHQHSSRAKCALSS